MDADSYKLNPDNALSESNPSSQWLGGRLLQRTHNEFDIAGLIKTDDDLQKVLHALRDSPYVSHRHKQDDALKEAEHQAYDKLFALWNTSHDYSEDEEDRVKDFDQNHRIDVLWRKRHKITNYGLAISFHIIVIVNFLYCMWESYGILVEESKFSSLFLEDVYQCLNIVPSQDASSHFISIFHAITCVAVLHAKTLNTANLCWSFLFGTTVHACFKVYEFLFNERFARDPILRGFTYGRLVQLIIVLMIQLIAIPIILQRYYDLTATFQKRAHKFSTQTYEGRQFNDRIIYRNVSTFVQRKFVLRSCTSYQIYNTVQKILSSKKRTRKGETYEDAVKRAIKAAVTTLKDVEGFRGMEMMRELKRRNYEKLKEEFRQEIVESDENENEPDVAEVIETEAAADAADDPENDPEIETRPQK